MTTETGDEVKITINKPTVEFILDVVQRTPPDDGVAIGQAAKAIDARLAAARILGSVKATKHGVRFLLFKPPTCTVTRLIIDRRPVLELKLNDGMHWSPETLATFRSVINADPPHEPDPEPPRAI